MNVTEILTFNTQVLYVALSLFAIIDYVRHRTPRHRDFALMASALGFPLGLAFIRQFVPIESTPLSLISAIILFSQPYFLFRLLQYYRPSRRIAEATILIGLITSCVFLLLQMQSNPTLAVTLIFIYCATVEAYCTWGFYKGRSNTSGTLRRRLGIITISSAIFSMAFIISVLSILEPAVAPIITPVAQAAAAISAMLFYVAFIPPRFLRRAWQMGELYNYQLQTRISPSNDAFVMGIFQQLSLGAVKATNSNAAGVLRLDKPSDKWSVLATTAPALFSNLLQDGQTLIKQAWQDRQPVSHTVASIADAHIQQSLQKLDVQTWLLLPVLSQERLWGLLVVALKDRTLFIDDDLNVLELMARECALVLDNHRLIDELQKYSESLEQRVEERTAALQRSNEELRSYAYVASHDLQEPLRMVISYLQLIERRYTDKLDEEGREFIGFAVGGARRMKSLIQDLLSYSRVESREIQFTRIDVKQIFDETRKLLDEAIHEADAHITHDPLPRIVADEGLLLQLFQNLIDNALKYRTDNKPEIHISAEQIENEWVFSIRDNGIGIDQQFADRIFKIFQRLHTQDKYPGTGIGLAICKKAVELHEGRIWLESEMGKGSTFYFSIPIRGQAQNATLSNVG